ncbi:MAG: ATP-binding protein [Tepidibacillus sp.]
MVPWWNRIKFKLLFFGVMMSIVPIAIIGLYTIQTTKAGLEGSIQEKQLYIVQRAATEVEHLLTSIKGRMQLLIDSNEIEDLDNETNREKWEQSLYGFLKQNPEIENAYVFDENGKVMASAMRWEIIPQTRILKSQLEKLKTESQNGQCLVGDVLFKEDGNPYVNIGVPFYSPDHQDFHGGIIIEISLRGTFKQISAVHTGNQSYIYLIDDKSRLIAHTDFGQVLLTKNVIISPELKRMVEEKEIIKQPISYQSYTGEKVMGAYAPIKSANWGVVIEQPIDKAFAPIDLLVQRLILMMLIVTLIVVLVSIIFGVWFTKPIELMEKAVRKVTQGFLNVKINYKAKDEFGKLSEAFNRMTNELQLKSEHLEQEKERLDTIINGSRAGFALVHEDFTVEWMNDRLKEWLANDEKGLSCYTLLGRLKEPCKDCPITLKDPKQCQNEVVTTINELGENRIYSHRMYPLERVRAGEANYLVVVEDITEQRQLEEMVVQADKLSALGILASGFAHEVNNPLASISAYAEDLKERIKEEPTQELILNGEVDHYLDIIRNNVDRCKMITNNLLNFSRKNSFVANDVDPIKVLEDSLVLLQHSLKKKQIQLVKKYDLPLPLIHGDGLQIQQVLINIIQNAIDAMDENGLLEIQAIEKPNQLEIHIKDNGHGMNKEQLIKVFDPFYTTKSVGKGTGLGLYISYNILKKMNGDIRIESEEGKGTIVTIVLPTTQQKNQEVI